MDWYHTYLVHPGSTRTLNSIQTLRVNGRFIFESSTELVVLCRIFTELYTFQWIQSMDNLVMFISHFWLLLWHSSAAFPISQVNKEWNHIPCLMRQLVEAELCHEKISSKNNGFFAAFSTNFSMYYVQAILLAKYMVRQKTFQSCHSPSSICITPEALKMLSITVHSTLHFLVWNPLQRLCSESDTWNHMHLKLWSSLHVKTHY